MQVVGPPCMPSPRPLSYIVCATARSGHVTISTIRPLTQRAQAMLAKLSQPPVDPSSLSLDQISQLASTRPGSLLLASLGNSKVGSRQHPAITGFSACNPPLAVNAIKVPAVAELVGTPTASIAQGLTEAVETATGLKGPFTARRLGGTARTIWVDDYDPSVWVQEVDWEVQGPGGQDFVMTAMEPKTAIQIPKYDTATGSFTQTTATVKPAPTHTSQVEVGRGVEYMVECTAGAGTSPGADLVRD